ncbi:MAG: hypothetical protein ABSG67_16035 [Thermoguttaceae bacterium]|jgi:probable HAF family extracellular repeat protein
MNKYLKFVSILCWLLLSATPTQAAVEYSVTYMGNFVPTGINNSGDVIGNSSAESGASQAVLYSNGILTNLKTLGGPENWAFGINNNGQIVGVSEITDGPFHAFLYDKGQMNDLGTFGGASSDADGINNDGQIAANYETADGVTHAILYDHGAITELGNFGGNLNVAKVINSKGEIAGQAKTADGLSHLFVYQKGNMTDLGIVGNYAWVEGMNDAGQIVGGWGMGGGSIPIRAFLYENGCIAEIESFSNGTFANCINAKGDIVGYGPINGNAFLYSNGTMSNLNDLVQTGITLDNAYGINDVGQIVASGYSDQYGDGAYILNPVPEPACIALECSGAAFVLLFVVRDFIRRKK